MTKQLTLQDALTDYIDVFVYGVGAETIGDAIQMLDEDEHMRRLVVKKFGAKNYADIVDGLYNIWGEDKFGVQVDALLVN